MEFTKRCEFPGACAECLAHAALDRGPNLLRRFQLAHPRRFAALPVFLEAGLFGVEGCAVGAASQCVDRLDDVDVVLADGKIGADDVVRDDLLPP
jgi:hypothetical protein